MSFMRPQSFMYKRAATLLEGLGCIVMPLESSFKGEVVGK